MMYRLESIDPGIMMPELSRRMTDDEGNALVHAWIPSLHPQNLKLDEGD